MHTHQAPERHSKRPATGRLRRGSSRTQRVSRVVVALGIAVLVASLLTTPRTSADFSDTTDASANTWSSDTLDPPTAVTATGGGTVTLNWTPTPDMYALGHRILRSTSPGGPYTQIAQTTPRTTAGYVDSPPSGTYYYVIRAYTAGWESVNSNEDSATVNLVGLAGGWQTGLTHTAAAGPNRALIFIASNEEQANSTPTITSVTYGGQPLTQVISRQVNNASKTAILDIWILDEAGLTAAVGTAIVPTWTSGPDTALYSHAIFDHVHQVAPTGATAFGISTADTPNPVPVGPIATTPGDMVIGAATAGEVGTYTAQNGFLLGVSQSTAVGGTSGQGSAYKPSVGPSETLSMLFNPASPPWINRQIVIALEVNPTP